MTAFTLTRPDLERMRKLAEDALVVDGTFSVKIEPSNWGNFKPFAAYASEVLLRPDAILTLLDYTLAQEARIEALEEANAILRSCMEKWSKVAADAVAEKEALEKELREAGKQCAIYKSAFEDVMYQEFSSNPYHEKNFLEDARKYVESEEPNWTETGGQPKWISGSNAQP